MLGRIARVPAVSLWLLLQILKSTRDVAGASLTPGPVGPPVIVRYPLMGTTDLQATMLSWAITVTPSTLVIGIGDREIYVHCVLGGDHDELIAGFKDMERRLLSVLSSEDSPERSRSGEEGSEQ